MSLFLLFLSVAAPLPGDLMVEILLRVPARSLVRLRSVCKSWNALIVDPQFASIHLEHAKKHILLLGFSDSYLHKSVSIFTLNNQLNTLYKTNLSPPRRWDFYSSFDFADCFRDMVVAGSYNGIVCLSSYYKSSFGFVALWNPAINRWRPIRIPPGEIQSVGLAYDSHTNDYKIIRLCLIESAFEPVPSSAVYTYSANKASWTVQPCPIPYFTIQPNCSVVVEGVPYWSRSYKKAQTHYQRPHSSQFYNHEDQTNVIASIDPHTGVYKEISYPPDIVMMNENTSVHPINLRDSLAVLVHSPCDGNSDSRMFHVYSRDESCAAWIKVYTTATTLLHQTKNIFISWYFEDDGKNIVVGWDYDRKHNFFYDPKTNYICDSIGLDDFQPRWDESYYHVESLVCINGMDLIQNQDDSDNYNEQALHLGRELVPPF